MPHLKVQAENAGVRLDIWLAQRFPDYSRAFLQKWVKAGRVKLEGKIIESSYRLRSGEQFEVADFAEPPSPAEGGRGLGVRAKAVPSSQPSPVLRPGEGEFKNDPDIIFEDASLLVLNKPAGLVVHPAFSYRGSTLIDWLRHHLGGKVAKLFTDPERLGLVHRLDKDTSGVLVIAKSVPAQVSLSRQFRDRTVRKTYAAWVQGIPASKTGVINAPVGRSRKDPTRMAVTGSGRASETSFEVKESLKEVSLLIVRPKTGRTHQIRVHAAAMGHPIVGDVTYGADPAWAKRCGIARPLLHAQALEITHPQTAKPMIFKANPPADFRAARAAFRKAALSASVVLGLSFMSDWGHAAVDAGDTQGAPTPAAKPHHKASTGTSSTSAATKQMRKEIGSIKDQLEALQAQMSSLKDEMAGIEAGLTQLDAARRIRDLERALPDMNAKLTTASNSAEEARSEAADTTRKMRGLQDAAEQFRDQLDRLQRQLIVQHAKREDAQITTPAPVPAAPADSSVEAGKAP